MKFFQSLSSQTQLTDFKCASNSCLSRVLCRLPCFHSHTTGTHHRIPESTELRYTTGNPGVVAKLMGLDSIPQRVRSVNHQENNRNLNTPSQSISQTPMVLKVEKGKFFVLGFEAGCKGKRDLKSDSKRKLLYDDVSKKKKLVIEASKVDLELEFVDQLLLELVYIF